MFRKIINSSSLQRLYRISRSNARLPCRALSSQAHAHLTPQLPTPFRACRSPPRHCSYLSDGENSGFHPENLSPRMDKAVLLESDQHRGDEVWGIDVLVALLRQENAQDICVIRVPPELKYTQYFIVASGASTRHLRAMASYALKVYKFLKSSADAHVRIEGKDAEDWVCIDFGEMVVHLMLPAARDTYELEKLWTLRHHDNQLSRIPPETLPIDFIYGVDAHK
ncbi:hypothetical protein ACEWY4_019352 [Coilia grayii]|uniref:Mitochondrial assembly of ribosomal large subunit protein 1 n=1 Tax=Coilia grayii TaxID=363190 RepID=A0ABD1J9V4_9TELE